MPAPLLLLERGDFLVVLLADVREFLLQRFLVFGLEFGSANYFSLNIFKNDKFKKETAAAQSALEETHNTGFTVKPASE